MKRRDISIAIMVIVPMVIITTILLYTFNYYNYDIEKKRGLTGFFASKESFANQLTQSLALPLLNHDKKLIEKILENAMEDINFSGVSLYPQSDNLPPIFYSRDETWIAGKQNRNFSCVDTTIQKRVIYSNENLGTIRIDLTTYIIEKRLKDNFNKSIWDTLVFDLILVCCFSLLLWFIALKPLKKVEQYAIRVSSGNLQSAQSPNLNFYGEIRNLFYSFQKMVNELNSRYDDLKKSEEEQQKWANIFKNAEWGAAVLDTDGETLRITNHAFAKIHGYSTEELINMPVSKIFTPECQTEFIERIRISIETGHHIFESVNSRKNNTTFPAIVDITTVKDEGNRISYHVINIQDITERKQTEEALRQSEIKYSLLFENMTTGFALHKMIYDENENPIDFRYVEVNSAFEKFLGITSNELIGKTFKDIFPDEKIDYIDILNKVALTGKPYAFQNYISVSRKYFDNWIFSYEKGYFAIICTDITEKKEHEIALNESNLQLESALAVLKDTQSQVMQHERLRALGQLASGIAHDINNSLMPVLGYAELLLINKEISDKAKRQLNTIKTASMDIRKTIERMKEFYRPKIGEAEYKKLDLEKIISTSIEFTKHRWKDIAESEGIVISIRSISEDTLPEVMGDESEIREALTNLIINACDAMPSGGIIEIKTYSSTKDLIIEINDSGFGMDEDTLNHCMDPFFTTKKDKGTGLGLSMVYGIMQRHNGYMKIESKKGIGTSIKLFFENNKVFHQPTDTINAIAESRNLKILCIDDDPEVLTIVKTMLESNNHKVITADSGMEGLEIFNAEKENSFDIIITDLGMPFMDGKYVSESIKKISPEIPVILLTGWGSFIDEGSIKSVDYILRKPVSLIELEKSIDYVLKLKKTD
jgi:PAS domain S-box-containing protein